MSDNGKEPSAPRLGFRSFSAAKKSQSEQLARPSQWSPGVRVLSAEEYDRFTDQLARGLLATCTPEHIAVIAAQHMIYADELKCSLEEHKADPVDFVEITGNIATKIATEVTMKALEAWRKHRAEKRAEAVRDVKKDVKALARKIATDKWREDTHQKIKIGEMAENVYDALKKTEHCKLVSSSNAVKQWIGLVAPEYARKRGPSRK